MTDTRRALVSVALYLALSLLAAAATLGLCFLAVLGIERLPAIPADAEQAAHAPILVIDAGHGGEDGGASGANGLCEKDVNLRIAEALRDQLTLAGIKVVMTRTDDRLLYDPTVDYHGRKKMLDLRARLDIMRETPNAVFVSIHQNAFPQTQYHGLQVYCSPNTAESARLGELIRTHALALDPENHRKCKTADSAIYLLHRAECPAVLVECGFLSNPDECARLGDTAYLGELATAMLCAIGEYLAGT